MNYVFDTSPLIYLIEKWRLADKLLQFSLTNKLYIPTKVKGEFLEGSMASPDVLALDEIFSVITVDLDRSLLPYFNFDSSDGAIWVISHARRNPDCCCVIDEKFGRNICSDLSVNCIGSIGIVIELKKADLLSSEDLLDIKGRIRKSKFYCTEELLSELDVYIGHWK